MVVQPISSPPLESLLLPIVSAHDVRALARAAAAAIDALVPCDHTGLYFLNPHTYQLELVRAKGFTEPQRAEAQASLDRRHPGWVVRHRQALYVPDTDTDPLATQQPAPGLEGVRSRFYVPLLHADQCLGTLGVASYSPHAFTEPARALFQTICDFTAQSHARLVEIEQLRQSRRQLETAISAADEGLWEWDIKTGVVQFSVFWQTMLGYEPDELAHREETFFALLHPDDVPLVSAALRAHFQDNVPYAIELRMKRKDGNFGWMLARGQASRDADGEVRRMSGTHVDMTALKEAQEAMRQARDAALESSRLKSAFVANMSHEVRTPMSGIIGLSYLLLDTDLNPQQREYVGLVRSSAEALLGVLNDVLDFSKIESGRLDVDRTRVDLSALLAESLAVTSGIAASKGLQVTSELPAERLEAEGDPLRVRQVLLNLLGNALKFTQVGSVTVRGRRTNKDTVRVEVEDTGTGVPPDAVAHVFQPFRQADGSTTRRFGGTGLGLAISQQLVTLMDGTIGHAPRAQGGSVFWFELPAVRAPRPTTLAQRVCTLDSDVIELRLLRAVRKGAEVIVLERLEDLGNVEPPADLLIVAGNSVKPERLRAALDGLPVDLPRPDVVVRSSDAETTRAFADAGFTRAVRSIRELLKDR